MTRLLLDTHALLWLLLDPARIPGDTLERIRDRANQISVSAASAWEIATKHRLGRLDAASAVVDGYAAHLRRLGADELAISGRHALTAGRMPWAHRDPFDRVIAAQSMLESMPLVTHDRALRDLGTIHTVW